MAGSVAVLANPTAGKGRHRGLLPAIADRLARDGRAVRLLEAGSAAEAAVACQEAVAAGASALIAVGGDGTVHVALQAVAGTDTPLGIVPAGTGNDFAACLDLPADPLAAAGAIATALRDGTHRRVDLAHLVGADGTRRWYGAVLGAGFDAIVNERANAMRWPRGARRYDIAIFAELVRLRPRRYTVRLDGVEQELEAVLVAVGNTARYGGGMRICPDADPHDGLVDVVIVGPISRTTLVRIKPRVYEGTHVAHRQVSTFRASTVELAAEGMTAYIDGERACPLPVIVTSRPDALKVLA